uniref:Uncharacterized protein n=1 Tax=Opuntia streptacantha TaxID=393608 RepID=A0A7C8YWC8_OPUST
MIAQALKKNNIHPKNTYPGTASHTVSPQFLHWPFARLLRVLFLTVAVAITVGLGSRSDSDPCSGSFSFLGSPLTAVFEELTSFVRRKISPFAEAKSSSSFSALFSKFFFSLPSFMTELCASSRIF